MEKFSTIIIGCTFILSGTIGLAIENLSEAILLSNNAVYNSNIFYYLLILFIIIGIILIILSLIRK